MGAMPASGSATVTPSESATYRLTAKGPGGVLEADARITVAAPGSSAEGPTAGNDEELFLSGESPRFDIFFEFNESSITENQFVTIKSDAQFLKQHPDLRIVVEGHCDQTGSSEYNLALGDRRANMVKSALEKAGVSSSRMRSISYGKEQLFCEEETDACLRQNRRVHIAPDIER
jgi:peptidoglycan-associated lipoprotein